jgi:C1A family cysteine protease
MSLDEIKVIRSKIKERVHSWSAGSTSVSDLSPEERKARLRLCSTNEELNAATIKITEEEAIAAHKGLSFIYPQRWDWRNVSNDNWTTPAKDEGDCGAYVAFAVIAAIESSLKIFRRAPKQDPDLSEADLFFRGCGDCCRTGWNIVSALKYAQSSGIPDEACYPYISSLTRFPGILSSVIMVSFGSSTNKDYLRLLTNA